MSQLTYLKLSACFLVFLLFKKSPICYLGTWYSLYFPKVHCLLLLSPQSRHCNNNTIDTDVSSTLANKRKLPIPIHEIPKYPGTLNYSKRDNCAVSIQIKDVFLPALQHQQQSSIPEREKRSLEGKAFCFIFITCIYSELNMPPPNEDLHNVRIWS